MMAEYAAQDIARHNKKSDLWVIIHGKG